MLLFAKKDEHIANIVTYGAVLYAGRLPFQDDFYNRMDALEVQLVAARSGQPTVQRVCVCVSVCVKCIASYDMQLHCSRFIS